MKEKVFFGKGIRRVLSLMFCLAVCLILIPMTASAATDATPITQVIIRGMERLYAGESVARDDLKKLITVSTTSSSTDILSHQQNVPFVHSSKALVYSPSN